MTPYRGTAASLRNMAGLTIGKLAAGEVVKQVIGARSKSALLREFAEFF